MKKILVTGGCGFVGRHLVDRLLSDDHNILVVDDLSSNGSYVRSELIRQGVRFFVGDCRKFFNDVSENFDEVFHLAAVVGGRNKIDGNPLDLAVNFSIDSEMFMWAREHAGRVFYMSSSAVYPVYLQEQFLYSNLYEELVDFSEPNSRLSQPDQVYGWAKFLGEALAWKFVEVTKKQVFIFRPFSGFGEDQSLDYPIPSLVDKVFRTLTGLDDHVEIWGSGEQVRDFVYIDDVIDVILKTPDVADKNPFTINIGTGIGTSFIEVVKLISKIIGKEFPYRTDITKPSGVFYRVANVFNQMYYNLLPPANMFERGLKRVINFYRNKYE